MKKVELDRSEESSSATARTKVPEVVTRSRCEEMTVRREHVEACVSICMKCSSSSWLVLAGVLFTYLREVSARCIFGRAALNEADAQRKMEESKVG